MQPTIITAPTETARKAHKQLQAALESTTLHLDRPVVFAVGGDGTMLRAIRESWQDDPIFVGIAAGHLGFLQAFEPEQIPEVLTALNTLKPQTISAPLIAAWDQTGQPFGYGFNDISLERSGARASRFHLDIDGSTGSFIGDGVIFATAFGSTAYSLAAGGPVIDSRLRDVFVVTPNNPHVSTQYSSLQRPHVLQRGRQVKLHLTTEDAVERPTQLVIDGNTVEKQLTGTVTIALSNKTISFLQLEADSFHARLDAKRLGRS